MFLAWREIKYSKTRFALIIGVVILIAYLVFFLTGLAYGLAQENRMSIDKWDSDGIVLADESNLNINMSMFPKEQIDDIEASEKASLGVASSVVQPADESDEESKINVTFFGIDKEEFIFPEVVEGEEFESNREVIADISLREEEGIEIGDELSLAGMDLTVEIVGFTENAKFSVGPVLYTNHPTYQEIRASGFGEREEEIISAIVVRSDSEELADVETNSEDLNVYSTSEFISNLPGYTAQVLTFGLMIGFLVLIAAMIIGIFIYVLTLQKSSMLGVMKAQGISSSYIAKSVIGQTFLLSFIGVFTGLGLTLLTGLLLPATVPYQNNFIFLASITSLLIIVAVAGAFFSVRTVVNIDPLEAID
ncbi:putative ABC transport system permease protein [Alkalibacterium putridalgicola]|uniref:Putative hemin transport system permease protein HrtB n=1 Tax=Alkalibacterium putridalgicola TaxID=426703 RepID=A0A1H7Q1X4_9LACT|nr:ABC transporter permease [Alkalibacterium putridalgicola]GEK88067.1 ABC transporter permease [Alkalibacterium putridalgicola]SEL42090.1 putative ABC transport system permease protein [Alkalibacterium putridalgicola]